ncbi:MAG TPA: aldose 1-epimerase [Caulobacteraceae bacterium]|nr:aldose 1-epimerase [Caulobacteraceae bacterium]
MSNSLQTIELRAAAGDAAPGFLSATVLPSRGMLLLQAKVRLVSGETFDLLTTPEQPAFGSEEDFAGNVSFSLGGAILLPYANRITGRPIANRQIETQVLGQTVRLPMNWGGKAEGAEQYAMHGLMLDVPFEITRQTESAVTGLLHAGDFDGRWLSQTDVTVTYELSGEGLRLTVEAANVGAEPLPMGIGWHPWFNLPSGDRAQAILKVPARARTAVNDYDEVLPTGEVLPLEGAYNFSEGRALGDLYLDDCFVDLVGGAAEVIDPAGGLGLCISANAPPVKAFQVYAPPDKGFVVVEPQFNWADPFNPVWKDADTGMAVLRPGERIAYDARVEVFAT